MQNKKNQGWTLIELIVVIAIVAIVAGAVLVTVNPAKRIGQANDAQRWSEARSILTAVNTFASDNDRAPHCANLGIDLQRDDNWRCLGPGIGDCPGGICDPGDATVEISYIRPTSAACGGDLGVTCFNSLSDWEPVRRRDLTADNTIEVVQIEGDWSGGPDETSPPEVSLDHDYWTTDADRYIKIYTTPEARHDGKWNDQKYILDGKIRSEAENIRIEGLQMISTNDNKNMLISNIWDNKKADIRISNNIFNGENKQDYNIEFGTDRFSGSDELKAIRIWNNIFFDADYAIRWNSLNMIFYIYNNTIKTSNWGIKVTADAGQYIKNNLIEAEDAFNGGFNEVNVDGDHYSNNSISEDIVDNALGLNGRKNQTFKFSDGFHLASDDLGAKDHGVDLSDDPNFAFTDDIDGGFRNFIGNSGWDIGADEYGSGACCDLEADLVGGGHLPSIPEDPTEGDLEGTGNSEYYIKRGLLDGFWVGAPYKSEYHDENLDIMVAQ